MLVIILIMLRIYNKYILLYFGESFANKNADDAWKDEHKAESGYSVWH